MKINNDGRQKKRLSSQIGAIEDIKNSIDPSEENEYIELCNQESLSLEEFAACNAGLSLKAYMNIIGSPQNQHPLNPQARWFVLHSTSSSG